MLQFPKYTFKIQDRDDKKFIYDRLRKKYVALLPEEFVRQNMIEYLINEKNYPESLMNNEVQIKINGLSKRCDSIVFNTKGEPIMLIEYKAPNVEISQKTFDQIAIYNLKFNVEYLLISNGIKHYCFKINHNNKCYDFLSDIPLYSQL